MKTIHYLKGEIPLNNQISGLPPVLPVDPKVLILGSMPGVQSLEGQQYYMNPRNHFWPILFKIFNQNELTEYEQKINWIKSKQVALWDTIQSCIRKGSLDSTIKDYVPNDIEKLLDENNTIKCVLCNGTKAYDILLKNINLVKFKHVHILKMPSTSPIPGRYTKSFIDKVEAWSVIADYIDKDVK